METPAAWFGVKHPTRCRPSGCFELVSKASQTSPASGRASDRAPAALGRLPMLAATVARFVDEATLNSLR